MMYDGIRLPAVFRECVDYVEKYGMKCEGIYRVSGIKSKVDELKAAYDREESPNLEDYEPNTVASLLKQYFETFQRICLPKSLSPALKRLVGEAQRVRKCRSYSAY
ncbi:ralA-binding protein 1-like [Suncus etruscus]|uniref:ralA-binding protein 1-like n=1 Tax=Suncus etruscus TaxID=109475 RepID=UPI00210FCE7B|nr:ralA-binding protein 1-like [Suncus etruscus]